MTSNEIFLARDVFRAAPFGGSLFRVRAGGQKQADDLRILGETASGSAEEAKVCVCVCPCGKGILLEEKDTTETSHLKINGALFEISLTYVCVIAMDYV